MELFEQISGQEGEKRVLGGPDAVVRSPTVRMFFARRLRRHDMIGYDNATVALQLLVPRRPEQQRTQQSPPQRWRRLLPQGIYRLRPGTENKIT